MCVCVYVCDNSDNLDNVIYIYRYATFHVVMVAISVCSIFYFGSLLLSGWRQVRLTALQLRLLALLVQKDLLY
jgi:hypothetical protein